MCNSEIFTYTKRKIQIIVEHIRPTALVPIGVEIALLVLGEVCEYTRTPSWGLAIFTQTHLQNHRQMYIFIKLLSDYFKMRENSLCHFLLPDSKDGPISMLKLRLPLYDMKTHKT